MRIFKKFQPCIVHEGAVELKDKIFCLYSSFGRKELQYRAIDCIVYGVDECGYYFRFHEKDNTTNEIYTSIKKNIRYRIDNKIKLVEIFHNFGVKILPDMGQYGTSCDVVQNSFVDYCQKHNGTIALLNITKDFRSGIFCINACLYDKKICKIIDLKDMDIEQEFDNRNYKEHNNKKRYTFKGVYILNKYFTLGQGYCIVYVDYPNNKGTPIVMPEPNFIYSHNKDVVKLKIIEFFNPIDSVLGK